MVLPVIILFTDDMLRMDCMIAFQSFMILLTGIRFVIIKKKACNGNSWNNPVKRFTQEKPVMANAGRRAWIIANLKW